jgi:hypothetical protein
MYFSLATGAWMPIPAERALRYHRPGLLRKTRIEAPVIFAFHLSKHTRRVLDAFLYVRHESSRMV